MLRYIFFALCIVAASNGQAPSSSYNLVIPADTPLPLLNDTEQPATSEAPAEVTPSQPTTVEAPIEHEKNNTLKPSHDSVCVRRNAYYKIDAKCDSYIECRNFNSYERLCPDGLHFNPDARWPDYACSYPGDVPCRDREIIQPPKPTAECQHQYGFYPLADDGTTEKCNSYIMCVAGKAILMKCPFGLSFNPAVGRCDWPENVPSCHIDDVLGFRCPEPPMDEDNRALDIVQNYRYDGECYYFFSCNRGKARVLSCDYGFAFDPEAGRCVDEDLVKCDNIEKPTLYSN